MADTLVYNNASDNLDERRALWGPYWISTSTAVIIFIDISNDLYFTRTVNGGANWGARVLIHGSSFENKLSCWFDQETPGDSGTLVHIVWVDNSSNDVLYRTLDVSDGSLGTQRIVRAPVPFDVPPDEILLSITKTVGGNLLCVYHIEGCESGCYRSVDAGVNWTVRTDLLEGDPADDEVLLFPADTADPDDACAIFWDDSASAISIKMYDDSANTWTETAIAGSMAVDPHNTHMDASVRHSDKAILLVAHSEWNDGSDDLETWELLPDSIAAPTITGKTNIFTNQNEAGGAAVLINQQNDDVYVAYLKGGLWYDTVDAVFHKSNDGMATWGAEQAYSEGAADKNLRVQGGRTIGNDGGRVQWTWFNDDLNDIFINLVNDIEIAASSAAGPTGIKTVNDLAIANIKTINDLAIGSVKTING